MKRASGASARAWPTIKARERKREMEIVKKEKQRERSAFSNPFSFPSISYFCGRWPAGGVFMFSIFRVERSFFSFPSHTSALEINGKYLIRNSNKSTLSIRVLYRGKEKPLLPFHSFDSQTPSFFSLSSLAYPKFSVHQTYSLSFHNILHRNLPFFPPSLP